MAVLYVAEFVSVGGSGNFPTMAALVSPVQEQTIVVGGVSTQVATAFDSRSTFVRLHTDTACSVKFGANPTATTANARLIANQTEYFPIVPLQKVAVIAN